jgi:hypothetical protein
MEKVTLSEEERSLSPKEIMAKFSIPKYLAHKAKKRGYFFRGHYNSKEAVDCRNKKKEKLPPISLPPAGEWYAFTPEELLLSNWMLGRRYGIHYNTALKYRKAGGFVIPKTNADRTAERWTPPNDYTYDFSNKWFRVNLAQEELNYPIARLVHLYRCYGVTEMQMCRARQRGFFCPYLSIPFEPKVDEVAFAAAMPALWEEVKRGVSQALRKLGIKDLSLKGVTREDLEVDALEELRLRSGDERFAKQSWRVASAKFATLRAMKKEFRKRKLEAITVDQMEGRFAED